MKNSKPTRKRLSNLRPGDRIIARCGGLERCDPLNNMEVSPRSNIILLAIVPQPARAITILYMLHTSGSMSTIPAIDPDIFIVDNP